MSNLRDLIHYADLEEFENIVGAASSTCAYTNIGSNYLQINFNGNAGSLGNNCWNACQYWRAPQGTKYIKFEVWGGGGSGAGVNCCGFGYPGGSGAYAWKELCCREYGDLSGCPYEMNVSVSSCIGPRVQYGFHGCKTYVRGYGLDNFCANGGGSGWNQCNGVVCGNTDYETQRNNQPSGGWILGDVSSNYSNCMIHEFNCGYSQFNGGAEGDGAESMNGQSWPGALKTQPRWRNKCDWDQFDDGYYNRKYGVGYGNTFGSNCQRININHASYTPCYGGTLYTGNSGQGYCAMWFGGDGGHHGLYGMGGSPCNFTYDNHCMFRQYIPFPAGLINDRGGYVIQRSKTRQSCYNEFACQMTTGMGYGANMGTGGEANPIPGIAGWSASTCAGACYCGYNGASGQVQITYYT